ncbi:hypothetical protein FHG87_016420 [Trinorchestia longiramus]|nr:hypothetical protein FHG87_016420 [Trinorchestia longiramus]
MIPMNRRYVAVVAALVTVQHSLHSTGCTAASVWRAQPTHSSVLPSFSGLPAQAGSQLVELRRSQVPKTTLPLQTHRLGSSHVGPNVEVTYPDPSATLEVTSELHQEFESKSLEEIPRVHVGKNLGDNAVEDTGPNFYKGESFEDSLIELISGKSSELQEAIEKFDDLVSDNDIDDSATRATMLWRAMAARFPGVASKAAMYWRVLAATDPATAAKSAMEARKKIALDPEKMARAALSGLPSYLGSQKRRGFTESETRMKRTTEFSASLPPYWQEFAAHDAEVTARSASFWLNDDQANMYW